MIKREINPELEGSTTYEEDGTVVIGTKVNRSFHDRLQRLCMKRGMKIYGFLRNCVDTILRYTDEHTNKTPEIEEAMQMFEHMDGWKDNFTLADPYAEPTIVKAVYIMRDKDSKGSRCVLVNEPYFGKWTQTFNVQEILECVLEATHRELYHEVRDMGIRMGSQSVSQTLHMIVADKKKEADLEDIRAEFQDNDRSEYGVKPDMTQYKRKMHHSIDDPSLHFDEKVSTEEPEDFRPFAGEW